jgi:hypothetical protein
MFKRDGLNIAVCNNECFDPYSEEKFTVPLFDKTLATLELIIGFIKTAQTENKTQIIIVEKENLIGLASI